MANLYNWHSKQKLIFYNNFVLLIFVYTLGPLAFPAPPFILAPPTIVDFEPVMEEQRIDFTHEAQQCLDEVAYAITEGVLCQKLPCDASCAHMNLTTKESREMTIRLSMRGFEVKPSIWRVS